MSKEWSDEEFFEYVQEWLDEEFSEYVQECSASYYAQELGDKLKVHHVQINKPGSLHHNEKGIIDSIYPEYEFDGEVVYTIKYYERSGSGMFKESELIFLN